MNSFNHAILRINRLALDVSIGVYAYERYLRSVFVTIIAEVGVASVTPQADALAEVVDYDLLVIAARKAVADAKHIHLLETLCQRIADECLKITPIQSVVVQVEKMQAMSGVDSVMVEIRRQQTNRR